MIYFCYILGVVFVFILASSCKGQTRDTTTVFGRERKLYSSMFSEKYKFSVTQTTRSKFEEHVTGTKILHHNLSRNKNSDIV